MKKVPIQKLDQAIDEAVQILESGGVILYPTDTQYGLGVDAENEEAVEKIFQIKERVDAKIIVMTKVPERYVEGNRKADMLMTHCWPGKLTIEFQKSSIAPSSFFPNRNHIALRQPDHPFCHALMQAHPHAITSTSANKSGEPPATNADAILQSLGNEASLIDLVIDAGDLGSNPPSTVVGFDESGELIVFREGAIPRAEIETVIE